MKAILTPAGLVHTGESRFTPESMKKSLNAQEYKSISYPREEQHEEVDNGITPVMCK